MEIDDSDAIDLMNGIQTERQRIMRAFMNNFFVFEGVVGALG